HAQRRTPDPKLLDHRTLFAPRIRYRRHFSSAWLGHALSALAIRKILLGSFLRTPRLHRHVPVDRPGAPTFDKLAHQPHLARLPEPGNQANTPGISRRGD